MQIFDCHWLLSLLVDPNICDVNGDTPLHTASKMRDLQAIARLRRAGASDSIQNKAGFTPRMLLDELSLPRSIIPGVHSLQRKLALHSPVCYYCHFILRRQCAHTLLFACSWYFPAVAFACSGIYSSWISLNFHSWSFVVPCKTR